MKTLLFSLLLISTQTTLAHEDCAFHYAPVGSSAHQKATTKSADAVINAAIKAKEKFDELLKWFNTSKSKNISVLSVATSDSSIDNPLVFSPKIIAEELQKLQAQMSPALKEAIFSSNGQYDLSRISEVDIIRFGPKISGLYDLALRYELLIQNKSIYAKKSNKDVRGFYYLFTKKINDVSLNGFSQLSVKDQNDIKSALIGICRNSDVKASSCKKEVENAAKRNTLASVYKKYYNNAVLVWNSYFQIPDYAKRKDITFRNGILELPFKLPENKQTHDFVLEIEKFWNNTQFSIHLDMQDESNIPNISFLENSVAHVDRLGGNNIVMNKSINMNLDHNKKVLSHEFGHVLGLPDCYIEFYDENQEAFVNYQLNKTDFMCSTAGKLTPRIIEELKRVYGNN